MNQKNTKLTNSQGSIIVKKIENKRNYELVEIKGAGHPDTLADELAEEFSIAYSRYTLKKFNVILHHNFDKSGILGGASFVKFGYGQLTSPIRILINGRVSTKFGKELIPYKMILEKTTNEYLKKKFPLINLRKDVIFQYNISIESSPGNVHFNSNKEGTRKNWFTPRSKDDIKELSFLGSNDTSIGVGFAPLTKFESTIKKLEIKLNSLTFKKDKPWLGSDIKIMGTKVNKVIDLTLCAPQISRFVKNYDEYKENISKINKIIYRFIKKRHMTFKINININTRDDFDTGELYLTAIGSSIESGDEGLVGRGNRINQLICQTKPYTMEGIAGKNPVYHAGKLYSIAAQKMANILAEKIDSYIEVYLISQSGRLLIDPWKTIIGINKHLNKKEKIELIEIVKKELKNIPKLTKKIIKKELNLSFR